MSAQQIAPQAEEAVTNPAPAVSPIPVPTEPAETPRAKTSPKDTWWVLVFVPLVVALVPLINTLLAPKTPERHGVVQNNNFSGPMFFGNVSLIEQQYQQITGRALTDPDLRDKIKEAGTFAAQKNFAAAASLLSEVAQTAPVPAVYNDLGVAYANTKDGLGPAEEAFRNALEKDPHYKAAWVNLGLVQDKQGKSSDALKSFLNAPDLAADQIKAIGDKLKASPPQSADSPAIRGRHDILSATPITVGAARQVTVVSGDENYFRFVTPAKYRDWMIISMTNRSTTLAPQLRVFNAEKSDISGWQYNGTVGSNLEYSFVADPGTTYYVAVSSLGGNSGDCTLLIRPAQAYDRYEPNDDILHASPIELGKPIEANIMDGHDADYYQFKSPSHPGLIVVAIANTSTTLAPALTVFDAQKSDISGLQYNLTRGANFEYTFEAQPNSIYSVEVSGSGTWGEYTLTLKPK